MKHFHSLPVLFFTIIFVIYGMAAASVPDGVSLTKTQQGYHIDFSLPGYQFEQVTAEGREYLQLTIPEYGVNPVVGLPALPIISFNLFISQTESQPGFELKDNVVSEMILKHKIYPVQMPWEKSSSLDERPFAIDLNYYNSTGNMDQSFIRISEPFIIGGVKGVTITLFPFRYNPGEDRLYITSTGAVEILFNNPVSPVTDKSFTFNQFLSKVFVNYEWSDPRLTSKYLIITDPSFETGMQQFVTHKVSKGFQVDMFNTTVTGTTTTAIKNFIQTRYNEPSTKPEYVLLVGDVAQIPAWTGTGEGSPRTDVNYVQLEGGDYFADAFIGRFSIANTTELQNVINKSVFMENFIGTLNKKNIYMSSSDNYQITEGTHNYVINQYFGPAGYTNLKLYTHTYNATTTQLINALNDNQIFAVYSGHGSETSWADGPPLSQLQVRSLTNSWYPFVYSFACVTGSYHLTECFGETWLRTTNGGSTFYGSSVNSYWDEDDILERRLFKAMFEDGLTRVTPMFDMAKIYLVNHYGGIIGTGTTTLRYVEMYNLMGDPSMPVVEMGPPCPIDPPANPNPSNGATNIPIAGNTATWTNGAGASQIEVWFGETGNLVQVYNGVPITSLSLSQFEPFEYNTIYGWQVKGKNDTCVVPGTVWTFTTMQDPNLFQWVEPFPNLSNWTIVGPLGTTNWSAYSSANAGGTPPELRMNWSPSFTGVSKIRSIPIDLPNNQLINYSFNFYLDWYANPSGIITVAITYDGGATSTPIYTETNPTGNVGPTLISGSFTTPAAGSADVQIEIMYDGYSFNIDNIYWDNLTLSYIVPVELTSFTATSENGEVHLKWTTATETNNQGFEILRSAGNNKEWQNAGYAAGFGTTTEPKSYSFVDSKLDAGEYTYRLKQIDFDGTVTYSEEVKVEVEIPLVYSLEQNYPNPFNPSTTIKYSLSEDGFVKLSVYNLLGEEVTTLVNNEQKAGRYEVNFDASKLASGIYMYRLESNNFLSIKKMILIK
ncbi:MAG: T9SS type A sorting domain-containing protein [Ignavibacteriota bacterium]|nr:T9SS type A sorting domain-containing protein [Ignavibacteriales bacterium]MBL1122944.1 T9SS C-terminal target domain-containing protein [Ignavibacteriota bacterium]QKJ95808.1 MAG: T9SS type A sorting domain-containing protein [Ignavibacteriota bacterium]